MSDTPPLTYHCPRTTPIRFLRRNCRVVTFSSTSVPAYCPSCAAVGVEI